MVAVVEDAAERLQRLYDSRGDIPPSALLNALGGRPDDETLAELIDADGRIRIERGLPVDLSRYLEAVPDLEKRPVALDAAIEFSLRAAGGDGLPSASAVAGMIARYPHLEQAIRAASLLSHALWSTTQVRESEADEGLRVPSDFGPFLASGLQRYDVRELVGRGAQGTVYRAADRHLSDGVKPAWVAIKLLKRQVGDGTRGRFLEEAARARRIEHPSTVRVLDRGVTETGRDYIVYEFVEGPTLREFMQSVNGPLPPREAAAMVAAIARGLQAAHSVGVVHCDLKPDNILITRTRQPKIADFGLAVGLEDEDARNPSYGAGPLGNLAFIAPEQFRMEEAAYAPAADIYACGGVLYYLLTRQLPNGQSVDEVERNLDPVEGRKSPPDPREARPEIDRDLAMICMRAMALRPVDRYGSAESLANDLEAWLRHEPIPWTRPALPRRARLFFRRQPGAVAMLILAMVGIGIASGFGVAASYKAEQKLLKEKAELAQKRAEDEARSNAQKRASLAMLLSMRKASTEGSVAENWLALLTLLEGILGPELFAPRNGGFEQVWSNRIEAARRLANEPQAEGRTPDLEALLWQTVQGFFLLRVDRYAEATAVLQANRESFAAILPPEDQYLRNLDCMLTCATIRRVMFMSKEDRAKPEVMKEFNAAVDFLFEEERRFTGRRFGNTLHKLILENLKEAAAPGMLDRPDIRKRVNEIIRRINEAAD